MAGLIFITLGETCPAGTSEVTELRGRIPVGVGNETGRRSVDLGDTNDQAPEHTHTLPEHTHSFSVDTGHGLGGTNNAHTGGTRGREAGHKHPVVGDTNINSIGGDETETGSTTPPSRIVRFCRFN